MSVPFSVRLPEGDAKALEALAAATDRSKSYLVQKAVESYLAEYAEYRIALDRFHDRGDRVVTGAELRKAVGRGRKPARRRG